VQSAGLHCRRRWASHTGDRALSSCRTSGAT
jgi:hypothetical protein